MGGVLGSGVGKTVAWMVLILALCEASQGAARVIDDFTALPNAVLVDPQPGTSFSPLTVGTLTITASYGTDGGFGGFVPNTPEDPGNGSGYFYTNPNALHPPFLQLILSEPVAAFGITFTHFPASSPQPVGTKAPAGFEAYAQPGLDELIGRATTFGMIGLDTHYDDFVAIQSDSANIRSISIFGTYANFPSFAVDAYAISYTPIPEPASLGGVLILCLICTQRRRGC